MSHLAAQLRSAFHRLKKREKKKALLEMSHKQSKVHEVHSKTFSNNKTSMTPTHMHVLEEKGEPKRYRTKVLPLTSLAH